MKYKVIRKQNTSRDCFVCGTANTFGLYAKFYECEKITNDEENGEKVLLTIFTPKDQHQSYPGRMHGGIGATILDEAIGRAYNILYPDAWGVTMHLTTKFRKPTPLNQTLYVESKITKTGSRAFDGEGKVFTTDGTICITGEGRYLTVPLEQITGGEPMGEDVWFYQNEDLPEYIEI